MQRASVVVRWAGLCAILLGLFTPMNIARSATNPTVVEPGVTLLQEIATPEPQTDARPGEVTEPVYDPGPPPSFEEPDAKPEDLVPAEDSGLEEQAISADMGIQSEEIPSLAITPDRTDVPAGEPIGITFSIVSGYRNWVALTITVPDGPGWTWTADDRCAVTSGTISCEIFAAAGEPALVRITSPTTTEMCGNHQVRGNVTSQFENWPDRRADLHVVCAADPELSIAMSGPNEAAPGETISYTISLTNTGADAAPATSFQVQLPDTGRPWTVPDACTIEGTLVTCTGISVAANDPVALSITGTVGSDASQCNGLSASARLTGDDGEGASASFETTVTCTPAIGLTSTLATIDGTPAKDFDGTIVRGTKLTFEHTGTNTGNIALSNVAITDLATGSVPGTCRANGLVPGDTLRCTTSFTISQEDVDRGSLSIPMRITGAGINGESVSSTSEASVAVTRQTSISIAAQGVYVDPDEHSLLGSVSYTFTATNSGTTTLTGVTMSPNPGGMTLSCAVDGEPISLPVALAPGEDVRCDATREVSQAWMDAGVASASVIAWSKDVQSNPVTITTALPRNPRISIDTSATQTPPDGFNRLETVSFAITVSNTGNTSLGDIVVTDDNAEVTLDCLVPILVPGQSKECTASATIEQQHVDAGSLTSTARVTASIPGAGDSGRVSASDQETVPTNSRPNITLSLAATPSGGELVRDEEVTYKIVAANTGTVTLTGVAITAGSLSNLSCMAHGEAAPEPVTLAPGETLTCAATYRITRDDVDRGEITTTAVVSGRYGETEISDSGHVTIGDPSRREARVVITATASPQNGITAGTEVTFSYSIRNAGDVTLSNVTVSDDTSAGIDCGDGSNVIAALSPGTETTCTATRTFFQAFIDDQAPADSDAGWLLTTTATIIADSPTGMTPAQVSDEETISISGPYRAAFDMTSSVTHLDGQEVPPDQEVPALTPGQVVTVALTASNTGDVTLHDVRMSGAWLEGNACGEEGVTSLAPGGTLSCTANIVITQESFETDVDRTIAVETGLTANDPQGTALSDSAAITLALAAVETSLDPALAISTTTVTDPGAITATLTLTNTGNVTLYDISLPDHDLFDSDGFDCGGDRATLPIAASLTCTVAIQVTQDHVDEGNDLELLLRATAASTLVTEVISDEITARIQMQQIPKVSATIVVDGPETGLDLGDVAAFHISVTNTGNVTLGQLTAGSGDTLLVISCPDGMIAPGETAVCTAQHTVTEADIVAGTYEAMVTTSALTRDNARLDVTRSATVMTAPVTPSLAMDTAVKHPDQDMQEGSVIDLVFTITNTGNVTVRGIGLESSLEGMVWQSDDRARDLPFESSIETLMPGESVTREATYTVTGNDVAARMLRVVSVASSRDDGGEPISSAPAELVIQLGQALPSPTPSETPSPVAEPTPLPTGTPAPSPTTEPTPAQPGTPVQATPMPTSMTDPAKPLPTTGGDAPATDTDAAADTLVTQLPSTGSGESEGAGARTWFVIAVVIVTLMSLVPVKSRNR